MLKPPGYLAPYLAPVGCFRRCRSLLIAIALSGSSPMAAAPIPEPAAIDAVIGEAGRYTNAMLPIACVIHERGSLEGIYGGKNPVVKQASPQLRARAAQAWHNAACIPYKKLQAITHGCKYFGSPSDAPYFVHLLRYHPVFTVGTITFYHP